MANGEDSEVEEDQNEDPEPAGDGNAGGDDGENDAVEDGEDDAVEDGEDDGEEDGEDDAEEDGEDDAEEDGEDDAEEDGEDDAEEDGGDNAEEDGGDDAEEDGGDDAEEDGEEDGGDDAGGAQGAVVDWDERIERQEEIVEEKKKALEYAKQVEQGQNPNRFFEEGLPAIYVAGEPVDSALAERTHVVGKEEVLFDVYTKLCIPDSKGDWPIVPMPLQTIGMFATAGHRGAQDGGNSGLTDFLKYVTQPIFRPEMYDTDQNLFEVKVACCKGGLPVGRVKVFPKVKWKLNFKISYKVKGVSVADADKDTLKGLVGDGKAFATWSKLQEDSGGALTDSTLAGIVAAYPEPASAGDPDKRGALDSFIQDKVDEEEVWAVRDY